MYNLITPLSTLVKVKEITKKNEIITKHHKTETEEMSWLKGIFLFQQKIRSSNLLSHKQS